MVPEAKKPCKSSLNRESPLTRPQKPLFFHSRQKSFRAGRRKFCGDSKAPSCFRSSGDERFYYLPTRFAVRSLERGLLHVVGAARVGISVRAFKVTAVVHERGVPA